MAHKTGENLMGEISGNGYVKWKGLVIVMVPLIGGMLWFSYASSEKNLSKETFSQFEKRFEGGQVRIHESIKDIHESIKDLTAALHQNVKGI